jgi:hypothetical protein
MIMTLPFFSGDPRKGAKQILQVVESGEHPVNLFLGTDAYKTATTKRKADLENLEKHKKWSLATDHDDVRVGEESKRQQ